MLSTEISTSAVFSVFIIFSRVGSACMLLPGIGEADVPARWKVLFGILLSIIIYQVIPVQIPPPPDSVVTLSLLIIFEAVIGVSIGLISKIILSALHIAGMIISMQSGLSAAVMFDPGQGTQGSIVGNLLQIITLLLLLLANLHLDLIKTLANSYNVIGFGNFASHYDNFMGLLIETVSSVWAIGLRLSMPFVVAGLIMFISMGILSRLMPQLQMFFLMLPAQILLFIFLLGVLMAGSIVWFLGQYQDLMQNIWEFS